MQRRPLPYGNQSRATDKQILENAQTPRMAFSGCGASVYGRIPPPPGARGRHPCGNSRHFKNDTEFTNNQSATSIAQQLRKNDVDDNQGGHSAQATLTGTEIELGTESQACFNSGGGTSPYSNASQPHMAYHTPDSRANGAGGSTSTHTKSGAHHDAQKERDRNGGHVLRIR